MKKDTVVLSVERYEQLRGFENAHKDDCILIRSYSMYGNNFKCYTKDEFVKKEIAKELSESEELKQRYNRLNKRYDELYSKYIKLNNENIKISKKKSFLQRLFCV